VDLLGAITNSAPELINLLGQLRNAIKTGGKIGERLGELSKFLQQWIVPLDQDQSNLIPDVMAIVGMSSLT
jgi:hypothetical protein